jgi:hypothetical protein
MGENGRDIICNAIDVRALSPEELGRLAAAIEKAIERAVAKERLTWSKDPDSWPVIFGEE